MTIQFQPAALAGSIALALGFASSVYAAEQRVAKVALDTIVVTATRSEEKLKMCQREFRLLSHKSLSNLL